MKAVGSQYSLIRVMVMPPMTGEKGYDTRGTTESSVNLDAFNRHDRKE
jgi:hypothetical protein